MLGKRVNPNGLSHEMCRSDGRDHLARAATASRPVQARSYTKVFSRPNAGWLTRILPVVLGASLRNGAIAILEGAGWTVLGQGGEADDRVRAFGYRLGAAVVGEVGSG